MCVSGHIDRHTIPLHSEVDGADQISICSGLNNLSILPNITNLGVDGFFTEFKDSV